MDLIWVLHYAYAQADREQVDLLRELGQRGLPPARCTLQVGHIMGWRN